DARAVQAGEECGARAGRDGQMGERVLGEGEEAGGFWVLWAGPCAVWLFCRIEAEGSWEDSGGVGRVCAACQNSLKVGHRRAGAGGVAKAGGEGGIWEV